METIAVLGIIAVSLGYLVLNFKKSMKSEGACAGCSCDTNSSCSVAMKTFEQNK